MKLTGQMPSSTSLIGVPRAVVPLAAPLDQAV